MWLAATMAIPKDLDAFKALALCVGIELPGRSERQREIALEQVGSFLEIPTFQVQETERKIRGLLEDCTAFKRTQSLLDLPEHMADMVSTLERVFAAVAPLATPEVQALVADRLTPRLPEPTFESLLPVFLARMSRRRGDPSRVPRAFGLGLLQRHPAGFVAAMRRTEPHAEVPVTADLVDFDSMQPRARALYHLERARKHRLQPAKSCEDALLAWSTAFAGLIADACRFLWYAAQPLGDSSQSSEPPADAVRLFQDARELCRASSLKFPFHPHLDTICQAIHGQSYRLGRGRVQFLAPDRSIFTTMTADALLEFATRDVLFAHEFHDGMHGALQVRYERSPAVAAAWEDALVHIPGLREQVRRPVLPIPVVLTFHRRSEPPAVALPVAAPAPTSDERIEALLVDMFTEQSLRIFVHSRYPTLAPRIREQALYYYTHELVAELRRHGLLDLRFFESLHEEAPRRAAEIDAVAREVLVGDRVRATPVDAEIADLSRRIDNLDRGGVDATEERRALHALRRRQRAHPAPARGNLLGGRYLLDAEVGHGGFATVWRAYDQRDHRTIAVKILHANLAGDPIRRARFTRGMRTMQGLEHPNITRVHVAEQTEDGLVFAVLEFVPGGDLQRARRDGSVTQAQVLPIVLALADALVAVHDRGVIHRDIKPSNVLLTDAGTPRLTDFDLVLREDSTGGTREGALGTFLFTAPEAVDDAGAATAASDVYSLAMTLVAAYVGATPPMTILRDTDGFVHDLGLPAAIAEVVLRALSWDPRERYADARAFLDALRSAAEHPLPPQDADHDAVDILYWYADERGRAETVWLSEARGRAQVVDRIPGIVLAADRRIWTFRQETRAVRGVQLNPAREAGQSPYEVMTIPVHAAALVDPHTNTTLPLGLWNDPADPDIPVGARIADPEFADIAYVGELEHMVRPIFAAGPYLLVRSSISSYCWGAAHGSYEVDFAVLDLRTGTPCDLLTLEERAALVAEHAKTADRQLDDEHGEPPAPLFDVEAAEPRNSVLTMFYPHYDLEARLRINYQFTRDICYADSDRRWCDYTCSTHVAATRLPAALHALATAPRLLQQFWRTAPHHAGSHGWTAAARTPEARQRLRRTFDELSRVVAAHTDPEA